MNLQEWIKYQLWLIEEAKRLKAILDALLAKQAKDAADAAAYAAYLAACASASLYYKAPLVAEAIVDIIAVVCPEVKVNTRLIKQAESPQLGQASYKMGTEDEAVIAVRKAFRQGSLRQIRQVMNVYRAQYPDKKINVRALNRRMEQ